MCGAAENETQSKLERVRINWIIIYIKFVI